MKTENNMKTENDKKILTDLAEKLRVFEDNFMDNLTSDEAKESGFRINEKINDVVDFIKSQTK
jgi:hypothetical protein